MTICLFGFSVISHRPSIDEVLRPLVFFTQGRFLSIFSENQTGVLIAFFGSILLVLALMLLSFSLYRKAKESEQKERRIESILKSAELALWEWNLQTNQVKVNERWAELRGIAPNDPILKRPDVWKEFIHKDDFSECERQMNQVMNHRAAFYKTTFRVNRKDNKVVWIQNYGKVIEWQADGKPKRLMGINWDVTDQQEALKQSHDYETLLSYAIEHSKSGVAIFDKEMRYVYVSRRFHHMYGVFTTDVIGKSHYEIFPDLPEKWRIVHQKALQGMISTGDRDPYPRANGTVDYTRWECRPWYDSHNQIQGVIVYTEVISDVVKREEELEHSKQFLEMIIDNLPIGIAVHDLHPFTGFFYINDHYKQIYGLKEEDLKSPEAFWNALFPGDEQRRKVFQERVAALGLSNQKNLVFENIPLKRDGLDPHFVSAMVTKHPNSHIWISTVMDVTDQNLRQKDIEFASNHDYLTGLYNRRYFAEYINHIELRAVKSIAIVILDVNGLKMVNDALGFRFGDLLLKTVADSLKGSCCKEAVICRIGGDEFAMIILNREEEEIAEVKRCLQEILAEKTISNIQISVAFGYAYSEATKVSSIDDLIKTAETRMYKQKVLDSRSSKNQAIHGILQTIHEKFETERIHSYRVSELCEQMGQALDLSKEECDELKLAGLIHDVGKITTPDYILSKPGKLTPEEYELIKQHPERGYHILRTADQYSDLAQYALTHHERVDGTGYPMGLKKEEIPLFSRIIAICDAFEAMTASRPYRKAMKEELAIAELHRCKGTQFDAELVEIFIANILNSKERS